MRTVAERRDLAAQVRIIHVRFDLIKTLSNKEALLGFEQAMLVLGMHQAGGWRLRLADGAEPRRRLIQPRMREDRYHAFSACGGRWGAFWSWPRISRPSIFTCVVLFGRASDPLLPYPTSRCYGSLIAGSITRSSMLSCRLVSNSKNCTTRRQTRTDHLHIALRTITSRSTKLYNVYRVSAIHSGRCISIYEAPTVQMRTRMLPSTCRY
jgi:hypothetical protein